jgi:hypothetical protein
MSSLAEQALITLHDSPDFGAKHLAEEVGTTCEDTPNLSVSEP